MIYILLLITSLTTSLGFQPILSFNRHLANLQHDSYSSSGTNLHAERSSNNERSENKIKTKTKNRMTVQQIVEEVKKSSQKAQKKKYKRSRKRVEAPKQTYVYAAQRKGMKIDKGSTANEIDNDGGDGGEGDEKTTTPIRVNIDENSPIFLARQLGMNPALQSCDPSFAISGDDKEMVPVEEPKILGEIKVGLGESQTGLYAYIIEKPPGWLILEGNKKKDTKTSSIQEMKSTSSKEDKVGANTNKKTKKFQYFDETSNKVDTWELDLESLNLKSVMTPEELEEFELEGGLETFNFNGSKGAKPMSEQSSDTDSQVSNSGSAVDEHDSQVVFLTESRPSVVSWLKDLKAAEGVAIRGGNNWKAIAGAVDVDDSGVLVLCPKESVENIFIDCAKYVAVVGNGECFAPKGKKYVKKLTLDDAEFEVYAKLRKGRGDDLVTTSKIKIPDGATTCNDAVQLVQNKYLDGVRGDPEGNPLERRANRRLVHCSSLTVSSLTYDEVLECQSDVPDDVRVYSERRNHHEFHKGSFLGRDMLRHNSHTTAYREVNGAADGWPGWIVDRYGKWLFVQHDEMYPKGPLPSLHDGYTTGVYYFASDPDRSITGSVKGIKPLLLEGQPAPEMIEVKENGIKYLVNFDELSTGIFLDQRFQRAWLARHCTKETRVLNCFAHCGAFSIAAAVAGAETTSLDLEKKWLDRIEPQLKANGIETLTQHDRIFGDCKFFSFHHASLFVILVTSLFFDLFQHL